MSRLKVLHLITELNQGGAEQQLYNLMRSSKKMFDSVVLTLESPGVYGPKIRKLGVPVYCLNINRRILAPLYTPKIISLLCQLKPDLVQGWMYHGNLASILTAKPLGIPVIWNVRQTLYDLQNEKSLTRFVISSSKALSRLTSSIIYNSRQSQKQHTELGFDANKSHYIPNGFDCNFLKPDTELREQFRRRHQVPLEVQVVGNLSRFHPMKDHQTFLKAAQLIQKSCPDTCFILGGLNLVKGHPPLDRLIQEFPLGEKLILTGPDQNPAEFMNALDIHLTTSAWGEAFPNTIGEALACGTACVSTDVGEAADIISNQDRIAPTGDFKRLANSCIELLNSPPTAEERVEVREQLVNRFESKAMANKYLELYQSIS